MKDDDLKGPDDETARRALARTCASRGHPLTEDHLGLGSCLCGESVDLLYMVSPSAFMRAKKVTDEG